MTQLLQRLNEGGPYFMYPSLIILILVLILITKGFLNLKNDNSKNLSLISSIGLFALTTRLVQSSKKEISMIDRNTMTTKYIFKFILPAVITKGYVPDSN